jgi:hypothetical protein
MKNRKKLLIYAIGIIGGAVVGGVVGYLGKCAGGS